jgi:hypothetical protein
MNLSIISQHNKSKSDYEA